MCITHFILIVMHLPDVNAVAGHGAVFAAILLIIISPFGALGRLCFVMIAFPRQFTYICMGFYLFIYLYFHSSFLFFFFFFFFFFFDIFIFFIACVTDVRWP